MESQNELQPRLLGIGKAAQILGLSIWTLRAWAYKGRIASHKLGGRLMVSPSEIDKIVRDTERPRIGPRA